MGKIKSIISFCLLFNFTVNGGYSSWNLSSQCNVTCGQGEEIWRRSCNNRIPKNGGRNCTVLGKDVEYRICRKQPCPGMFLYVFFSSSPSSLWRSATLVR
jgi:hypothetical protein